MNMVIFCLQFADSFYLGREEGDLNSEKSKNVALPGLQIVTVLFCGWCFSYWVPCSELQQMNVLSLSLSLSLSLFHFIYLFTSSIYSWEFTRNLSFIYFGTQGRTLNLNSLPIQMSITSPGGTRCWLQPLCIHTSGTPFPHRSREIKLLSSLYWKGSPLSVARWLFPHPNSLSLSYFFFSLSLSLSLSVIKLLLSVIISIASAQVFVVFMFLVRLSSFTGSQAGV